MSSEHTFEDKGKVQPKPTQEAAEPTKDSGSLKATDLEGKVDASTLKQMQQTVGNAAVQRFLAQRQDSGPAEIQEETANAINSKRGSGGSLDSGVAEKAGDAMGQDFSDVNVHTDSQADELSRDLGAKAFTTGQDIFFQSGAYDPGSSDGQRLIAHELTHVVQQGGSAPSGGGAMTVNDPDDNYEQEADNIADQVMNKPDPTIQRQMPEEEEALQEKPDPALQRAAPDEEMMMKPDPTIQRQMPEEEEALQEKPDPTLQRAAPDEEMMMKPDPTLQRATPEEEEVAMPKLDPSLQRQEDEETVLPKLDPTLQRQEEEEPEQPLAMKEDMSLQRQEEEEPIQEMTDPSLQRQEDEEVV
ncbi:MAG: DUF4157 domain-containing protein [Chloroflexota bacterium]|jgi:hypothetical protein